MSGMEFDLARSALFVPGNRPERVDKAVNTRADAVIIDLEDAVPPADKVRARAVAREKIAEHASRGVLVRINALSTEYAREDIEAVAGPGLGGILLPKSERPEDLMEVDRLLATAEGAAGLPVGSVRVTALVESALGIENAFIMASVETARPRLWTLAFGAADFSLDVGFELTRSGEELAYPRARLAVACAAAALAPPWDTPYMVDLKDESALIEDIKRAARLGFGGKLCIHPNQVDHCNRFFSPDPEEIEQAKRVIEAFNEAGKDGSGAILLDGRFIDPPVVKRALRIVRFADAASERE